MGRLSSKSKKIKGVFALVKLGLVLTLFGGVSYLLSFGLNYVSEATEGRLVSLSSLPFVESAGEVAGRFIDRVNLDGVLNQTGTEDGSISSAETSNRTDRSGVEGAENDASGSGVLLTTCLLSDSHNDNDNLKKALDMSIDKNCETIIYLGDYSDVGTEAELTEAKSVMDTSSVEYSSIPGDHDHFYKDDSVENYVKVFGQRYKSVRENGVKFILVDNSSPWQVIDNTQLSWLTDELSSIKDNETAFLVISNPLFVKSGLVTSSRVMGEKSEKVREQGALLLSLIRNSNVKAVFAGDHHLSSRSTDPEKAGLEHVVVGALSKQRNLQSPRFSVLTVFTDGSYDFSEVVL